MYLSAALVAEVPPGVVTVMSTVPAGSAGAVAVIEVAELTVTLVAAWPVPNATVEPATNPVPVILTARNAAVQNGELSDVAPTILALLGLNVPSDMSGKNLVQKT